MFWCHCEINISVVAWYCIRVNIQWKPVNSANHCNPFTRAASLPVHTLKCKANQEQNKTQWILIKLYWSEFVPSCCQNAIRPRTDFITRPVSVVMSHTKMSSVDPQVRQSLRGFQSRLWNRKQSLVSSCHLTNNRLSKSSVKPISAVKD